MESKTVLQKVIKVIQIGPVPAKAPDGYPNEMPDYAYSNPERPVFLASCQYSQGKWDWTCTEDPLRALTVSDIAEDFTVRKFVSDGGKVRTFEVTVQEL